MLGCLYCKLINYKSIIQKLLPSLGPAPCRSLIPAGKKIRTYRADDNSCKKTRVHKVRVFIIEYVTNTKVIVTFLSAMQAIHQHQRPSNSFEQYASSFFGSPFRAYQSQKGMLIILQPIRSINRVFKEVGPLVS
jgi:hypothetical protein